MLRPIDTQTIYQQTPEVSTRQQAFKQGEEMQQTQFANIFNKETQEKQKKEVVIKAPRIIPKDEPKPSKKKKDKMAYEKVKFIQGWEDPEGIKSIPGALKLGVPEEVAIDVFGQMEAFASYAFNKSHAAAYSFLTFQTAYLKCYHQVEFLTSVISAISLT